MHSNFEDFISLIYPCKVEEIFGPGTSSGIKRLTIVDGVSRKFVYFPHARTDGLQTREEVQKCIYLYHSIVIYKFLNIKSLSINCV
jgi:hypothetical protein